MSRVGPVAPLEAPGRSSATALAPGSAAACGIGLPAGAGLTGPPELGARRERPGGACAALGVLGHSDLVGSVPSLDLLGGLGNNGVTREPRGRRRFRL